MAPEEQSTAPSAVVVMQEPWSPVPELSAQFGGRIWRPPRRPATRSSHRDGHGGKSSPRPRRETNWTDGIALVQPVFRARR